MILSKCQNYFYRNRRSKLTTLPTRQGPGGICAPGLFFYLKSAPAFQRIGTAGYAKNRFGFARAVFSLSAMVVAWVPHQWAKATAHHNGVLPIDNDRAAPSIPRIKSTGLKMIVRRSKDWFGRFLFSCSCINPKCRYLLFLHFPFSPILPFPSTTGKIESAVLQPHPGIVILLSAGGDYWEKSSQRRK